jgi:hypothetical protein
MPRSFAERAEIHWFGPQQVIFENVLRHIAGIEAGRHHHFMAGRFDLTAQTVRFQSPGAHDAGARNLRVDVRHQCVAADAQHVLGTPTIRAAVGEFELDGQRSIAAAHLRYIGIHARDEGADPLA